MDSSGTITQWSRPRVGNSDKFGFCQESSINLTRVIYIIIKFCCFLTFSYVKLKDDYISLPKEAIWKNSYGRLFHIHIPMTSIYSECTTDQTWRRPVWAAGDPKTPHFSQEGKQGQVTNCHSSWPFMWELS